MFKAAIFDFDGVLADTIPLHYNSFRQLFQEEGVDFTFKTYRRVANGAPRDRVIRAVLGEDLPAEKFEHLMRRKEEIVLELASGEGLRPIPGVLETVERLRQLGLTIGMASSSRTAVKLLEAMGAAHLFDAMTDALETRKPKPDSEVFVTTAQKLGVAPEECLVFEDAPLGIIAARSARMPVVAITTTTGAAALHDANWIIDSFVDFDPTPILFPEVVSETR